MQENINLISLLVKGDICVKAAVWPGEPDEQVNGEMGVWWMWFFFRSLKKKKVNAGNIRITNQCKIKKHQVTFNDCLMDKTV